MKKLIFSAVAILAAQFNFAQELPQPSPKGEVEQVIGFTEVEVEYSRPGVKGRDIWGDLVPFDKVWRAGANKATLIEFSTDATIGGTTVKAGSYSLFVKPSKKMATVYLNAETELWGTGDYDATKNVAEFEVEMSKTSAVESMLFYFDNVTSSSADLILSWAGMHIAMHIQVDYLDQAKANIEKALEEDADNFRVYNNAASFYMAEEMDSEQALAWAKQSTQLEKKFWNVKVLSEAYAANGDYKNAIKAAKTSLKLAQEADYAPYIKINQANIEKWSKM